MRAQGIDSLDSLRRRSVADIAWFWDWAMVDGDGQWFVFGRSDDAINVAGKRLGPAEVESVLDPARTVD